jgi:hypothetical protein
MDPPDRCISTGKDGKITARLTSRSRSSVTTKSLFINSGQPPDRDPVEWINYANVMTFEEFAHQSRSWGLNIKKFGGHYFYSRKTRRKSFLGTSAFPLMSAYPENYTVTVDKKLLRALRWRFPVVPVLLDSPRKSVYDFALTTKDYSIESFSKSTRKNIRKSLKYCEFRRPKLKELIEDGLRINRQTCELQSRIDDRLTEKGLWSNYMTQVYESGDFVILGAFYENRMNGYLIAYELEGKYNFLKALIDRTHARLINPMNGLLFTMINQLLEDHGGPITVSYGMHDLRGDTPLNTFKRSMQFEAVPVGKGYIINPIVLFGIGMILTFTFKVLRRKMVRHKLLLSLVQLYQGHRNVMLELKQ